MVDDDRIGRLGAQLLLKNRGFRITTANSSHEALERTRTTAFQAILTDVHMPVMDAMETTWLIRADSNATISTLPIIGLTASVLKNECSLYLQAGMNAVPGKPLDVDAIEKPRTHRSEAEGDCFRRWSAIGTNRHPHIDQSRTLKLLA